MGQTLMNLLRSSLRTFLVAIAGMAIVVDASADVPILQFGCIVDGELIYDDGICCDERSGRERIRFRRCASIASPRDDEEFIVELQGLSRSQRWPIRWRVGGDNLWIIEAYRSVPPRRSCELTWIPLRDLGKTNGDCTAPVQGKSYLRQSADELKGIGRIDPQFVLRNFAIKNSVFSRNTIPACLPLLRAFDFVDSKDAGLTEGFVDVIPVNKNECFLILNFNDEMHVWRYAFSKLSSIPGAVTVDKFTSRWIYESHISGVLSGPFWSTVKKEQFVFITEIGDIYIAPFRIESQAKIVHSDRLAPTQVAIHSIKSNNTYCFRSNHFFEASNPQITWPFFMTLANHTPDEKKSVMRDCADAVLAVER